MRLFIESVAREAGKEALAYFTDMKHFTVSGKATTRDLVSDADRAVEKKIIELIRAEYPEHSIFGEETGRDSGNSEYCWVIDPIDGTQSFVKRHPYFSISIALKKNGKTIAGCVYAPVLGLMFSAEEGKGAFENGVPMHVSDCDEIGNAACATGFACLRAQKMEHNNLKYFNEIVPLIRDIKRCGSAALDLAFVASGRYDAYWEFSLAEYDIAAGIFLVESAGGVVLKPSNGNPELELSVLAANPVLIKQFQPFFE